MSKKLVNECLFSVKLDNGIVITGCNSEEVQHFVLDMQLACHDSMRWTMQESDDMNSWTDMVSEYETMFHAAWFTIYKNLKSSED